MDDKGVRSQVQFLLHNILFGCYVSIMEAVGAGVGGGSSGNKMSTLEEYGTNLTKLAEEGKLDPVVGRQDQIERVTQILGRHKKNNPCLIGEPGVGKTAIAEGLALRIANGDVPKTIQVKKVITLDVGLLVAGTKYRGEFEVHTLIGAGAAEGANDAANILKPTLALGELQIIQIKNLPRKNSVISLKDYWHLELWATQILQKIMRTKLYKIRTTKSYRTSNVPLQIFQNSLLKK